jgi:hypothetical protein
MQASMQMSATYPPEQSAPKRNLCLMCLDGGGVRGLSSLLIVKQLMEKGIKKIIQVAGS